MSIKETLNPLFNGMQSVRRRTFIATAAALSIAGIASGQHTIGLKLGMNGNGNQQSGAAGALLPTDSAGAPGYAQVNWNILGLRGDNGTNSFGTNAYPVLDSNGDDTFITINWDATGNWSQAGGGTPTAQGTPDGNLMNGYCDSGGSANVALGTTIYGNSGNNKPLVYISGLQAWLATEGSTYYDVVIYVDGDATSGRTAEYWIQNASGLLSALTYGTDLTTHIFIRDDANFLSTTTYVPVPSTSNPGYGPDGGAGQGARAGNYAVFDSLSADSILIRTEEDRISGSTRRSPITAVQIIPRATPLRPTIAPLQASQVYAGRTARFRALAAGLLPMSYQWQKNGVNLTDGGNISGAATPTLTITSVSAGDAATYSLVASNANGMATNSAALTLWAPVPGSYAEKIITNNPVAYWRLNEMGDPSTNNTSAYDYVGGFNGTYAQAAMNGYNGVQGPQPSDWPGFESGNTALQPLNGRSLSWVQVPPMNLNTNTITITAWINPSRAEPGSTGIFMTRTNNNAAPANDAAGLGYGGANNLAYLWNTNTINFGSSLIPPSNQWSFVALAVSPTNAILYLYNTNIQDTATNAVAHWVELFNSMTMIGTDFNNDGNGRAFSGGIDEVAVFNRTVPDTELYLLFKKGLGVGIIPAVISVQPVSLALYTGRTATFRVIASGDKPLNYQWRTNGVNLVNGGRISGANSATLTISNVTAADAATYDVVVDNIAHTPVASSPATLTVVPPPSPLSGYEAALQTANPTRYWRFNEASGSVYAYDYWGGNIATNDNASAGQTGPQPPAFTGFENTNAANSYDGLTAATETGLSGVNNNLTQFSIIGWFNAAGPIGTRVGLFGQNDVSEFGFHGVDGSGLAQLGIWTPNGGAAFLSQTNITPGQWYFAAGVGDGTNINLYLFTTNGSGGVQALLSTTAVPTTNYGNSAFSFNIGGAGVLDATGNYFTGLIDEVALFRRALSASEVSGLFASSIGLNALPPQITTQPTPSTTLYVGRNVRLSVTAIGSSPLAYQWRTNGAPLPNGGNVVGATSSALTITNVTAANARNYDVVITNSAGAVTSSVSVVSVVVPAVSFGYENTVLSLNPLAYYRLNETNDPSSGTAIAYEYWGGFSGVYGNGSQNGFNGIMGPSDPPFFGFESDNKAVAVAIANNSWVTAPFGSLSTNTVTMAMWINPSGTFDTFAGLLVNRGGGVAGGFGYTGGQIGYTWNNNNANTYNFRSGFVPPLGEWSFVALVVTPTNAVIYYGDTLGNLQSATNVLAHTADVFGNNWQIGSDNNDGLNDGQRNFVGSVDEVGVFTYSLTAAQIQRLYSVGRNGAVTLTIQKSGVNVILSWPRGVLLEANTVTGPYTTNTATSPYTVAPSASQKYYRVIVR